MNNPFKFGTLVDGDYFTDRRKEQLQIKSILESSNHIVLISPRRFGKSSLVAKVVKATGRPTFSLNLQSVTSATDLANRLLRLVLKQYPLERIRHYLSHFRVAPTISINPLTNSIDTSFSTTTDGNVLIEDVFTLIEHLGEGKNLDARPIVVLDEFQEIVAIDQTLDRHLRSIMQEMANVNFVMLGSQESMMEEIFEKRKSPFYHFGYLIHLARIPYDDFLQFVTDGMLQLSNDEKTCRQLADAILQVTLCHPYYTQQLSFQVWSDWSQNGKCEPTIVGDAIDTLIASHAMDYERIWDTFNVTDRKMFIAIATKRLMKGATLKETDTGIVSSSTALSCLKRLMRQGYITCSENNYTIEDPFFKFWIQRLRE